MKTALLFKNGKNQVVSLRKDFEFVGISEEEIRRDCDSTILTPKQKSWTCLNSFEATDNDLLREREDLMKERRVQL